jgi:hypothetical protein
MTTVGAVGNAFCAFSKELVGAGLASTAPAASAVARDIASRKWISELGCLVGSAWGTLRSECHERICTRARQSVESIQLGDAPRAPVQG